MLCKFDEFIEQHLGLVATLQDFPTEDLIPDPEYFHDTNVIGLDHGDAKIMHEMGNNYLSAELMLLLGGVIVEGRVTARKQDQDGNPIEHANDNPILDTQFHIVDFDSDDQTEVTTNMIAKSLYLLCDPDGNQYVSLEEFVDHSCLPSAVKLLDQKTVRANGKTYLKCTTIGWQLCCQ
jgi:hypothetical protein